MIEAIANAARDGTDIASIRALSIGTGNVMLPRAQHTANEDPDLVAPRQSSTIVNDVKKMASCILDDPPDAASFHAHVMLGGLLPGAGTALPLNGPIVRMNPLVQPVPGANEPWRFPPGLARPDFIAIRDMPMDATKNNDLQRIQSFGRLWLADQIPNQSIRANAFTLETEIGFPRYGAAKAAAMALFP